MLVLFTAQIAWLFSFLEGIETHISVPVYVDIVLARIIVSWLIQTIAPGDGVFVAFTPANAGEKTIDEERWPEYDHFEQKNDNILEKKHNEEPHVKGGQEKVVDIVIVALDDDPAHQDIKCSFIWQDLSLIQIFLLVGDVFNIVHLTQVTAAE